MFNYNQCKLSSNPISTNAPPDQMFPYLNGISHFNMEEGKAMYNHSPRGIWKWNPK